MAKKEEIVHAVSESYLHPYVSNYFYLRIYKRMAQSAFSSGRRHIHNLDLTSLQQNHPGTLDSPWLVYGVEGRARFQAIYGSSSTNLT